MIYVKKTTEYRIQLTEKLNVYGFYSIRYQKRVLSEEYYISCQIIGMKKWVNGQTLR